MRSDRFLRVGVGSLASGLVMLLGGCGPSETAVPAEPKATASDSAPAPERAGTPRDPASGGPAVPDTAGASFGVDKVAWPATAQGALKLLNSLPQAFRGDPLEVSYTPADDEEGFGASAVAQYGAQNSISVDDEYTSTDTESGEPELLTADQLLAANFGLVFGCAKDTYRGTIEPLEGGYGPGVDPPVRSSETRWFSCRIDVAEGADDFSGHAVGWTSQKAAWLVIAEDEKAARSLVAGLGASPK